MIVSDYFDTVFDYKQMRERAEAALAGVEYDVLVGTGVSGMLGAAVTGTLLDKPYAVVRKDEDASTHSLRRVEGHLLPRFVVVDDFVASGYTVEFVRQKYSATVLATTGIQPEMIGVFRYALNDDRPRFVTNRHGH